MRIPPKPPNHWEIWQRAAKAERQTVVFNPSSARTPGNKYLHWDKLQHLAPPGDLTHEEWWLALKLNRQGRKEELPFQGVDRIPFTFVLADPIPELLHYIDQQAAGTIAMPEAITNRSTKDRYLMRSLAEEAITSSQLEGAATTREVAKQMIRAGRRPSDRSERMILNNYATMQRIGRLKKEPLTPELVCEIHRLITSGTLDNPSAAGRLRRHGEEVVVDDMYGKALHVPPPASQLEQRMAELCEFANGKTPAGFMHPAIRSMILHFWLAYDHPFVDGNGRTARALFYWSMLRHGYWLCEYISISEIIRKGPAKYGRAFLYTETDDNDLTYFLLYHVDVLRRAIQQLHDYVARKTKQLQGLEGKLRGMVLLNHRQRALVSHALRHPHYRYTIKSHLDSHQVVYQTARTDLLALADRGLFSKRKVGKTWHFTPVEDMDRKLGELS